MKRNYHIQLYRFIGAVMIMICHWNEPYKIPFFQGTYIWVEFFFMVSGFLMATKVLRQPTQVNSNEAAQEAWTYTKKKFLSLFPYHIIATIAMFIVGCVISNYPLGEIAKRFIDTFWEMSLLAMSGIGGTNTRYNGPFWFASALIIVGYFVFYFLKKHPHGYSRIFAPASVFLIYSFFWNKHTHISKGATFDASINVELAIIRALAGINLGIICYLVYDAYKDKKPNKLARSFLSVFELLALSFVIVMTYKFAYTTYDYIIILALAIIVVLAFLDFGCGKTLLNNKLVDFLGKISMPIYFNHVFVRTKILHLIRHPGWPFWAYLALSVVISIAEYLLIESIRKKISAHLKKEKEAITNKQ